jgi:hypothetical protein
MQHGIDYRLSPVINLRPGKAKPACKGYIEAVAH